MPCTVIKNCKTGASLRTCHECDRLMCLDHSKLVQTLTWQARGCVFFSTKRRVRVCNPCAKKIKEEEG